MNDSKSTKDTKQFKFSYYNVSFSVDNQYFIYNTLYGSLAKIDGRIKKSIDNAKMETLTNEIVEPLTRLKIIIDKTFDEKKYIVEKIKESKTNNSRTHVFFTITLACNCSCAYCFENKSMKENGSEYTWFTMFVKKIMNHNESDELLVDFFGGEPMLKWKEISKIINELIEFGEKNKKKVFFRFYTNGTLLNDNILSCLKEWVQYIKDFQITIDGPQKIHNKRRPLKINGSSFDKIIKNIGLLFKNGLPVKIRVNIDNENINKIPELLEDLKKYQWHKSIPIYFYPVQNLGESCSGYKNFLDDSMSSVELNKLQTLALRKGFNVNTNPNVKFIYCSSFNENSYVVDYKKNLYKCAVLQNPKHNIGKVTENGFVRITNKKELDNWMKRSSLEILGCKDCKLLPTCASGCGGSAYNKFGTHNISNCAGNKKIFFDNLKLYVSKKYLKLY